jgi:hypothetical protein
VLGTFFQKKRPALAKQEKTYNVASIVSSSTSIGGGVVAGVLNASAGFLRGHQTYYMVKDLDALAIPRPSAMQCKQQNFDSGIAPSNALTFAWQFRPVLGEKVVRDGTRQTFAQISLPRPSKRLCLARRMFSFNPVGGATTGKPAAWEI